MRKLMLFLVCTQYVHAARMSQETYELWSRAGNTWEEKWTNLLSRAPEMEAPKRWEVFAPGLSIGGKEHIKDYEKAIFLQIQKVVLETPGYAEYYRDRVLEAREQLEKVRAGTRTDMLEGTAAHLVLSAQGDCFGTLSLLPSAETIRVLGEFLDDHRGWRDPHPGMTETEREWLKIEVPNSYKAANALQFLPIVGKPFPKTKWRKDYSKEEIAIWKQWYDEIKDGKRTFRIEGDPVEYDLNGPAPKEKLERLALAAKRDGKREARHRGPDHAPSSEAQVPSQAPLVALLVACAAVLGSLVWYFRRANNI